ncbi:MAG: DUF4166 domain-containing protein [Spirulina sp. SIO3F2]|nr:DUF4166 domain-containing protein [Spirulina sp. SIO3F2]
MQTSNIKPLYRQFLDQNYDSLPAAVQALHNIEDEQGLEGRCSIQIGENWIVRLLTKLFPFPEAGENLPLRLNLKVEHQETGAIEHWTRYFGEIKFYSEQWQADGQLYEKIRNTVATFSPAVSDKGLELRLSQIVSFGRKWPAFLQPDVVIRETEQEGKLHFSATVSTSLMGMLVHYEGWVEKV